VQTDLPPKYHLDEINNKTSRIDKNLQASICLRFAARTVNGSINNHGADIEIDSGIAPLSQLTETDNW